MTATPDTASSPGIRSLIPARIDRLPWSKFHTRLVIALGVAWVLDGLEITIASNVGPDLTQKAALNMSASSVADIATWYLIGEVIGALFFGQLSDKLGRKNLFMVTLGVYLIGSGLTALTPRGGYWFIFLYGTRVIAGMGIGGEYAAINSAIDEMIPAKFRGRVDLAVNGTYWAGAFLGTIVTLAALNHISTTLGWRIAYLVGPVLALVIIFVRRHLPESPRWQIMHGREKQAEASIAEIEQDVSATKGELPPVDQGKEIEIVPTENIGYLALLRSLFKHYPSRAIYGGTLMITQSFLYNAIFFTYGLVLLYFFHVPSGNTPYYFMAFCAGNLLGPLTIGRLFDTVGRRKMISGTYLVSGILLVITAQLFKAGALNAVTQTLCWSVIFFFASAGASAGYLTVSEIFPLEVRAKAIAVFFAIAQCFGSLGSHLYGHLIGDGKDPNSLYWGYLLGAGAMILGGVVAAFLAVDAEGKSLEDVARPLSVIAKPAEAIFRTGDPHVGGVPPLRRRLTQYRSDRVHLPPTFTAVSRACVACLSRAQRGEQRGQWPAASCSAARPSRAGAASSAGLPQRVAAGKVPGGRAPRRPADRPRACCLSVRLRAAVPACQDGRVAWCGDTGHESRLAGVRVCPIAGRTGMPGVGGRCCEGGEWLRWRSPCGCRPAGARRGDRDHLVRERVRLACPGARPEHVGVAPPPGLRAPAGHQVPAPFGGGRSAARAAAADA